MSDRPLPKGMCDNCRKMQRMLEKIDVERNEQRELAKKAEAKLADARQVIKRLTTVDKHYLKQKRETEIELDNWKAERMKLAKENAVLAEERGKIAENLALLERHDQENIEKLEAELALYKVALCPCEEHDMQPIIETVCPKCAVDWKAELEQVTNRAVLLENELDETRAELVEAKKGLDEFVERCDALVDERDRPG